MNEPTAEPPHGLPAHRNPFRVDRLELLAFRPHDPALTADCVVQRFRDAGWHGAIVGPHGSGKSTLLKHLIAQAGADGQRVLWMFINRHTPRRARRAEITRVLAVLGDRAPRPDSPGLVLACDGWCHLSPWERRRLRGAARQSGARVLGLAHLCGWGLPVIYRTRTTPSLLAALVDELHPQAAATAQTTQGAWNASRGNLRDALLGMYDRSAAGRSPLAPVSSKFKG